MEKWYDRAVKITLTEGFIDVTANHRTQVNAAIGYLVCWALTGEMYGPACTIFGDDSGDLHAAYGDKIKGGHTVGAFAIETVRYTLFGQRREDGSYSFHS